MEDKRDVIIDVDTGIDDAIALCMATYSDKLNIKLITTICGNQHIGSVTKNTLNLLQAIDKRRLLVAVGANKPLERPRDKSIQAHGKTGLGQYEFPSLELKPIKDKAVPKMYQILKESNGKTTIIALGPLTNIARLVKTFPDIIEKIDSIVISGGLLNDNPKNPYIGFNIMQDPEAADIVLRCGAKIIIVPSDHGHKAYLTPKEIEIAKNINHTGKMLSIMFKSFKDRHVKKGAATHDPCATMYVAHPEIFKTKMMYVHLRYLVDKQTGVLDFDKRKEPNMFVATKINVRKFKKLFFDTLKKMP